MRGIVSVALACALVATGARAIVIRHDRGDAAYLSREADYPAIFALYRTKEGHKDCVATLISERWAITVAHCTKDKPFIDALAGSKPGYRVEIAGREAVIDRLVRHPAHERIKGKENLWVDLALVRLAAPVSGVAPIAMYAQGDELDRVVLLPGWGGPGNGVEGYKQGDGAFRVAENRIDTATRGWVTWKFDDPRSSRRALTLEGIAGPADSGGPALVRTGAGLKIVGVGSFSNARGGTEGVYGVVEFYARVSEHLPWIRSVISNR